MKTAMLLFATAAFLVVACSGGDSTGNDSGMTDTGAVDTNPVDTGSTDMGNAGNGTWTDPATGLTWQSPPDETVELLQQEAIDYCDALTLAGHGNWRLPTIGELRSLLKGCPDSETGGACGIQDDCLVLSCANAACDVCAEDAGPDGGCYRIEALDGICSSFWSASVVEDNQIFAWYIHFNFGGIGYSDKGDVNGVRCVSPAS